MAFTSTIAASSLSAALEQATNFLVRPLTVVYSSSTIIRLQFDLQNALAQHCAPTWDPAHSRNGSGRRCLTFSPHGLPPRVIYNAAVAAGIDHARWIALLTRGAEFDLSINPGRVTVSDSATGRSYAIWTAEVPSAAAAAAPVSTPVSSYKTVAQELIEADAAEDDALFVAIDQAVYSDDAIRTPQGWLGSTLASFPAPPPRSDSRASAASSTHSRSSSFSSLSSASGASFSSVGSDDSASSTSSSPSSSPSSRRERLRTTKVYIDATKKEVTPYDGGKTTVLTGGVMLGAKPTTPKAARPSAASGWCRA